MSSILILGAKLVNEGTIEEKDVLVDASGRISRIEGDLSAVTADETIDAAGHYLLPGLIDDYRRSVRSSPSLRRLRLRHPWISCKM
jgi:dihydroorotase